MLSQFNFENPGVVKAVLNQIKTIKLDYGINIMEVCGTHTHAIARYGIASLLPEKINLVSGPGCPVCVTPKIFIDQALELAEIPDTIITTFGDLYRVPGSFSSLQEAGSRGSKIKIVYSPTQALETARNNPDKKVIFLGVGFETTVPTVAIPILQAQEERIDNFFVLPGFKTLPNALTALAGIPGLKLNGFLAPGHLSIITGKSIYQETAEKFGLSSVITGFKALDILLGIKTLLELIVRGEAMVVNEYRSTVRDEGNPRAREIISRVFKPVDSEWRGMGIIEKSGLDFREEFEDFHALKQFPVSPPPATKKSICMCGEILTGIKKPADCPLFAKVCTPLKPVGPCMVSSEGTCSASYKYKNI
ncbi:MAG: hydrogenase formation protein HypD [Vulcanimicrobiota bacterium]